MIKVYFGSGIEWLIYNMFKFITVCYYCAHKDWIGGLVIYKVHKICWRPNLSFCYEIRRSETIFKFKRWEIPNNEMSKRILQLPHQEQTSPDSSTDVGPWLELTKYDQHRRWSSRVIQATSKTKRKNRCIKWYCSVF